LVVREIENRANLNAHVSLQTEILPTEFISAERRITNLILEARPDVILSLGVAERLNAIVLERFALNLDDTNMPDNVGSLPKAMPIDSDSPLAYSSTLPLSQLASKLAEASIPVAISNHAGTFVCNHIFYVARNVIERAGMKTMCGFVHLPLNSEQIISPNAKGHRIPLDVLVNAVELCIDHLQTTFHV
jgi:pyroglutamyl-peptidase